MLTHKVRPYLWEAVGWLTLWVGVILIGFAAGLVQLALGAS